VIHSMMSQPPRIARGRCALGYSVMSGEFSAVIRAPRSRPSQSLHWWDSSQSWDGVQPRHGSLGDFGAFTQRAEALGIRVIVALVVNHPSSQAPWLNRRERSALDVSRTGVRFFRAVLGIGHRGFMRSSADSPAPSPTHSSTWTPQPVYLDLRHMMRYTSIDEALC
jgi:hypothetical protein